MKRRVFILLFMSLLIGNKFYPQIIQNYEGSRKLWPRTTNTTKPWTRWWWMENAVDKKGINRELELMEQSGIGGVEITPIYGVKGTEESFISFLSPKWMEMLHHTLEQANNLDMGVAMNMGTGWPFGGPEINSELAAHKLIIQKFTVDGGNLFRSSLELKDTTQQKFNPKLVALTAYNEKKSDYQFIWHYK